MLLRGVGARSSAVSSGELSPGPQCCHCRSYDTGTAMWAQKAGSSRVSFLCCVTGSDLYGYFSVILEGHFSPFSCVVAVAEGKRRSARM